MKDAKSVRLAAEAFADLVVKPMAGRVGYAAQVAQSMRDSVVSGYIAGYGDAVAEIVADLEGARRG